MKKYTSSVDYYLFYLEQFAPYLDISAAADVLAGEELVGDDIKDKFGVGWKLPLEVTQKAHQIWHNELIKAIHSISGVDHSVIRDVLYYKNIINRYCGSFEHPKKKRRSVGKNVSTNKYIHYYTIRISAFTGYKEDDVEAILHNASIAIPEVIASYGYIPLLPECMQKDEYLKMQNALLKMVVNMTGLDETMVSIILLYKRKVSKLCGEPR